MKINYDKEADAVYIQLSELKPDGVVELKGSINVDLTENEQIVGIEILNVSKKLNPDTFLKYELVSQLVEV